MVKPEELSFPISVDVHPGSFGVVVDAAQIVSAHTPNQRPRFARSTSMPDQIKSGINAFPATTWMAFCWCSKGSQGPHNRNRRKFW